MYITFDVRLLFRESGVLINLSFQTTTKTL